MDFSYRLDSHEGAANAIVQLQGANMGGRPVKVRHLIDHLTLAAILVCTFRLTCRNLSFSHSAFVGQKSLSG